MSAVGDARKRHEEAAHNDTRRPLAEDGRPGCPVTVWDGPYSTWCGAGASVGKCAHHGTFASITPSGEPSPRRAVAREVAQFNELIPVGTPVLYWPALREGPGIESKTRTRAWLLGDHTPVVMVDGYAGGIALSHVCPIPPARTDTL